MKNDQRIIYGLFITIIAFAISTFVGSKIHLNCQFIPYSFVTHSLMLIISVGLIYSLKRYVNYKISLPQFKKTLKPILIGVLTAITINIAMTIIGKIWGAKDETHIAFSLMSPLQIFLFVFIYASVAEEMLFRGFLQNLLKPLKIRGIKIFKISISFPVLIGAIAFGLGHLILITTGAGALFLIRIVIFTTVLGIIAGHYQEKYDNNAYAIIVHMAGNLMGVIGSLLMSLNNI